MSLNDDILQRDFTVLEPVFSKGARLSSQQE